MKRSIDIIALWREETLDREGLRGGDDEKGYDSECGYVHCISILQCVCVHILCEHYYCTNAYVRSTTKNTRQQFFLSS